MTSRIILAALFLAMAITPATAGTVNYEHTWPAFTCDCEPGTEITYTVSYHEVGAAPGDTTHVGSRSSDGRTDYTSPGFALTTGHEYAVTVWGLAVLPDGTELRDHCTDIVIVPGFGNNGCECKRVHP